MFVTFSVLNFSFKSIVVNLLQLLNIYDASNTFDASKLFPKSIVVKFIQF